MRAHKKSAAAAAAAVPWAGWACGLLPCRGCRPRELVSPRQRAITAQRHTHCLAFWLRRHRFFTAAAARFAIWVLEGPPMRPLGSADGAPAIPVRGGSPRGGAGDRLDADDPATVRILEFELLG